MLAVQQRRRGAAGGGCWLLQKLSCCRRRLLWPSLNRDRRGPFLWGGRVGRPSPNRMRNRSLLHGVRVRWLSLSRGRGRPLLRGRWVGRPCANRVGDRRFLRAGRCGSCGGLSCLCGLLGRWRDRWINVYQRRECRRGPRGWLRRWRMRRVLGGRLGRCRLGASEPVVLHPFVERVGKDGILRRGRCRLLRGSLGRLLRWWRDRRFDVHQRRKRCRGPGGRLCHRCMRRVPSCGLGR